MLSRKLDGYLSTCYVEMASPPITFIIIVSGAHAPMLCATSLERMQRHPNSQLVPGFEQLKVVVLVAIVPSVISGDLSWPDAQKPQPWAHTV